MPTSRPRALRITSITASVPITSTAMNAITSCHTM